MANNEELLIRIDERVASIFNDIKEINTTIHGNGKTGLCEIAKSNTDRITFIENDLAEHKNNTKYIIATCLTIITVIIIIADFVSKYFF